ncbi:MAG: BlaI/MecI/CopY family transcriptional regulator [Lachnospiraceae bacterium]|jgi:BlaI family penicillinase repressor|nr:BlaI/MecI/CopY family transcriptional regulator [Lachnospiraceae bacterium]MCX4306256.1 BlaI/MecI/CopY family transcriptional regulator [Acetatifactor sp.]
MGTPKVFESEYRFCLILWENEPINSTKLARLCNERLGWSRTTTYTVIKRLSERGVVKNENAIVTSLVSKDEVQAAEIEELMEKTFEGSIPAFIAAFTKRRRLSREDVTEIRQMLDKLAGEEEKLSDLQEESKG